MAAVLKRFMDWANQPVSFGKKSPQPVVEVPTLQLPANDEVIAQPPHMGEIDVAHLNLSALSMPVALLEPRSPEEYLDQSADDVLDGLERFLVEHPISEASELSWLHLLDEMKVIQQKRLRLVELEKECLKIKEELQICKKNLAIQAKRAADEESKTITMHEKRLELSRALTSRIDAL
jgi:hypothetical protein